MHNLLLSYCKGDTTMSGGTFDYKEYNISCIADEIEQYIDRNTTEKIYSLETIEKFKDAVILLRKAAIVAHRIDYLLAGDDGEDTFHERLQEDLEELLK